MICQSNKLNENLAQMLNKMLHKMLLRKQLVERCLKEKWYEFFCWKRFLAYERGILGNVPKKKEHELNKN